MFIALIYFQSHCILKSFLPSFRSIIVISLAYCLWQDVFIITLTHIFTLILLYKEKNRSLIVLNKCYHYNTNSSFAFILKIDCI